MMRANLAAVRTQREVNERHVLSAFALFFASVIAINGVMIYSAISTHTGLVANEPYRKGLHYNERIDADGRQARLGWSMTLEVKRDGRISLIVRHADGPPVTNLKIEGVLGRPSTNHYDMRVVLVEGAPGNYQAEAKPLAAGNWLVTLDAFADVNVGEPAYRIRRRIWLKP